MYLINEQLQSTQNLENQEYHHTFTITFRRMNKRMGKSVINAVMFNWYIIHDYSNWVLMVALFLPLYCKSVRFFGVAVFKFYSNAQMTF